MKETIIKSHKHVKSILNGKDSAEATLPSAHCPEIEKRKQLHNLIFAFGIAGQFV